MGANNESKPYLVGMCYNSARDELFFADDPNGALRSIHLQENAGDLHDVYRTTKVFSVCHMSDSDSLLVWLHGFSKSNYDSAFWLVLLSRERKKWRETHRVQTAGQEIENTSLVHACCALNDSRVLIGHLNFTCIELFRVESGSRIERVHLIHVSEKYRYFSAMSSSDTLVAMSFDDESGRVNRLRDDRLEELARIRLKDPHRLVWLADRLLVAESNDTAVTELELCETRLERSRELIAQSELIQVYSWCALPGGLAICNIDQSILLYSFNSETN